MQHRYLIILALFFTFCTPVFGQRYPSSAENIDYLVTFGKDGDTSWGDDDFNQTFFFAIPSSQQKPFYIRIFDPEISGQLDEVSGTFDTKMRFEVYGGKGAHSNPDAQKVNPDGQYRSGTLLASKVFGNSVKYENDWFTFGPFNPAEGEYDANMRAYVFKLVTDGLAGNDGNLYYYYLSESKNENRSVEGANGFAYEYSFRMNAKPRSIAHIYPFITSDVVSITQHNFDFDNDGPILLYSVAKNRHLAKFSNDNQWATSKHTIVKEEHNTSMDLQLVKKGNYPNDVVFYITNQYNKAVAVFSSPIGGPPKYRYVVKVKYKKK